MERPPQRQDSGDGFRASKRRFCTIASFSLPESLLASELRHALPHVTSLAQSRRAVFREKARRVHQSVRRLGSHLATTAIHAANVKMLNRFVDKACVETETETDTDTTQYQ